MFPAWIATATVLFGGLSVLLAVDNLADGTLGAGDLWAAAPFALLAGVFVAIRARLTRRAKRLLLSVSPNEVRRGGGVVATLTIDAGEPLGAERVELGLVCVERYDEKADAGRVRPMTWPQTEEETVCEDWREVNAHLKHHELRFEIPPDPPYSYEGEHVSYA